MAQRIKGQEVEVTWTGPTGLEEGFTAVSNFEVSVQEELLTENYIGETTARRDDQYNGIRGRLDMHLENTEYFNFVQRVKDRSQRRNAADGQFNLIAVLNFPNGERKRIVVQNAFFGELPLNVGSRSEYVQATVEFEASDFTYL